jgi:non-heme chloroperoxidase
MTTRPDNPLGAPPEYFDGIIQGISADRANFLAEFVPSLFHTAPSTAIAGWIAGLGMNASMRATVRGLEEARDRDLRPGLSAIRIPTLIMHGIHDQVVPFAFAEEQQRLIAGSTLVPFQNSSHALFYEEQDRLNDELAAFAT